MGLGKSRWDDVLMAYLFCSDQTVRIASGRIGQNLEALYVNPEGAQVFCTRAGVQWALSVGFEANGKKCYS